MSLRFHVIVLFAALSMLCLSVEASENLLVNPGLENGQGSRVANWSRQTFGTPGGPIEVVDDPAQAHSGNKCVKLQPVGGYTSLMQGWGWAWDPGVYPGKRQKYLIKVWAKGKGSILLINLATYYGTAITASSNMYDDAQAFDVKDYKAEHRFPVTSDEWSEFTLPMIVGKRVTHLNLIVGISAGSKAPIFIDDIAMYDSREAQIRFLPSKERLVAAVDTTYIRHDLKLPDAAVLAADLEVREASAEAGEPVRKATLALAPGSNTLRLPTSDLPEGEYKARVVIRDQDGRELGREDDWFEKRIFEWMKNPRGVGPDVPKPYAPLEVKRNEVRPWGRVYRFAKSGLLDRVQSQGRPWLADDMELEATVAGKRVKLRVGKPFEIIEATPRLVRGKSELSGGGLRIELESITEYDGLTRFRLTYGSAGEPITINRLRLKAPLNGEFCKFYSSDGAERHWAPETKDPEGGYSHDLLSQNQGKVFDSLQRPQSGGLTLGFTGLFWLADHETCFCYAADNDQGWLLRDDRPSVEAFREGKELVLWLNLVDRDFTLAKPRTLEFTFQAGPTKPLPEGWRGIQNGGDTNDAPLTFDLMPAAGGGYTLNGATHFMHPGTTPELRQKSRERVEKALAGGRKEVGGYHFYSRVPKGFPETRVFRGEWGIDKYKWATITQPREWEWKNRFFGDNPDLCVFLKVNCVPSYVDFCSYAYDESLKETGISGFYDDLGYPKQVYDEELGLGYVRDDGARIASSGQWIYRDRWQRAAYINHKYNRPNFLWDSQHCHAHYLPAYNFIGVWAPCERGYYNTFRDRDILDYYGSVERYAAFNPSRQFGQIPMVGMQSYWGPRGGKDPVRFARETRVMMMLAFLNDQDVGSFGARDLPTVVALRRARNVFRTWEKDTQFAGYWSNGGLVKINQPKVLSSLYHRADGALFILGNTGTNEVSATVAPVWRKLKLDPSEMTAVDAETGEPVPLTPGRSGAFTLRVPGHDVRLVVVGPEGRYPVARPTVRTKPESAADTNSDAKQLDMILKAVEKKDRL